MKKKIKKKTMDYVVYGTRKSLKDRKYLYVHTKAKYLCDFAVYLHVCRHLFKFFS